MEHAEHACKHARPRTRARADRAQPKPVPKHTTRKSRLGLGRCKQNSHTDTHTLHACQHLQGGARTSSPKKTPQNKARTGGDKPKRAPKPCCRSRSQDWWGTGTTCRQAHPPHGPERFGGVQQQPLPEHTHHKPKSGMVGYRQHPHRTHATHTPVPRTAKTRTQAHTPKIEARTREVQAEFTHRHAHPARLPAFAGRSQNPQPKRDTTKQSQDWRG